MSTSSCRTVNRCASSLARSSTSPTSRSSRSASIATTSSDSASRLRVVDQPLAERLDVAADRRQRRPQLVRDGHQEVPLLLLRLGEPRGHLAEALGEVADLAAARHVRHARRRTCPPRSGRPRPRARAPAWRSAARGTRRARRRRAGRRRARPAGARTARTSRSCSSVFFFATIERAEVLPLELERLPDGLEGLALARRRELERDHLLAVDRASATRCRPARGRARAGRSRAGRRSARRRSRGASPVAFSSSGPAKSGAERPSSIERIAAAW